MFLVALNAMRLGADVVDEEDVTLPRPRRCRLVSNERSIPS